MAKGGIAVWNSPESKFTSVAAWATSKARLSWSTLIFFLSLRQEKFVAALNESYVNCKIALRYIMLLDWARITQQEACKRKRFNPMNIYLRICGKQHEPDPSERFCTCFKETKPNYNNDPNSACTHSFDPLMLPCTENHLNNKFWLSYCWPYESFGLIYCLRQTMW